MKKLYSTYMLQAAVQQLAAKTPPSISSQSETPIALKEGDALTLFVTAQGNPKPGYQWVKIVQGEESVLNSATKAQLVLSRVATADAATYKCYISNEKGTIESDLFEVSVAPLIPPGGAVIGDIYNKEVFSLDEFTKAGDFTAQIVGGKLNVSGGTPYNFANGLSLNAFNDSDENVTSEVVFILNSKGQLFSVGKKTTNTFFGVNHAVIFNTGANRIELYCTGQQETIASPVTFNSSVGDLISLKHITAPGKTTGVIKNLTTGQEVTLSQNVDYVNKTFIQSNTSKFTLFPGLVDVTINKWIISRQSKSGVDIAVIGDSKSYGLGASGSAGRYGMQVAAALGKTVNIWAGNGDRTIDQRLAIATIAALKPKVALMCIGRNNLGSGENADIQPDLIFMRNALVAAGTKVIHIYPVPEPGLGQNSIREIIDAQFPTDAKVDVTPVWNSATMVYDTIHFNQLGHDTLAQAAIPVVRNAFNT
jgi:lysophospholipase L1-like esterase